MTEAAIFGLTWAGILRIGETLQATRSDLILPRDAVAGTNYVLLKIRQPKTRGKHAKHQAARVDPADIVALLDLAFARAAPESKLWPGSAATLRRRFGDLMRALYSCLMRVLADIGRLICRHCVLEEQVTC